MKVNGRFTLDGSDALEQRLEEFCDQVRLAVQRAIPSSRLEGLLLAGSYGRGEGGVLNGSDGDRPYNDLEFYVFVRGIHLLNQRRFQPTLCHLAQDLSDGIGVETELAVASLPKLRRSEVTMFSYDLVAGHRWLLGDDSLFRGCDHHRAPERIPLFEATRLLMNRCSGLLFAKNRFCSNPLTAESVDFVARNIAKAKLALGDVLLAALGQYHASVRKRHQRLEKLELRNPPAWFEQVQHLHLAGVEFKLHPRHAPDSATELRVEHERVSEIARHVWLWLETGRLRQSFASETDYALNPANKCPECPRWRNRFVNARSFGLRSALCRGDRYPRERLLSTLPLLLWNPATLGDAKLLRHVQHHLQTSANSFSDLVSAYEKLWFQFN